MSPTSAVDFQRSIGVMFPPPEILRSLNSSESGPFKYLFASPVFHRWHHTSLERGGNSNFAGTFPFIDWMFGTFYMPEGELPEAYGIGEPDFPESFGAQMLYPLRR